MEIPENEAEIRYLMNEFSSDRSVARFPFCLPTNSGWRGFGRKPLVALPITGHGKAMWSEPKSWPPAISVRSTRGSPGGVGAGDNPDSWQLSELHMHLLQVPLARKE